MSNRKKVTLEEIAQKVNCSKSVVSRALNNKYGVNEETKNRIFVAALELGYGFDQVYTSHRKKGNNDVGYISVVVPRINVLDDKFYGQMVCGIEAALNEQNINFCLNIVETMEQHNLIDILHRTDVSGVIVLGLVPYPSVAEIICSGIPVVLLDTLFNHLKVDRITINNYNGGAEAAELFLKNGHRNIAFWGDTTFSPNFAERCRGLLETCRAYPEKVRTDYCVTGQMEEHGAVMANEKQIRQVLSKPDRPTAVLCATDQIAFRLYEIAREMGLSLPRDLSVIGFSNNEKCKWITPAMTSVDIPQLMIGKEAVNILLKRIRNPDALPVMVQMDSSLIVRDSVAPPSRQKN